MRMDTWVLVGVGRFPLIGEDKHWKILWQNVKLSARYGAGGARLRKDTLEDHHQITITLEDLRELWLSQDGRCHWLNIKMSLEDLEIKNSPFAVSVERLDSSRGYHRDNIVLCSRFANRGRGAYDDDMFKYRLHMLLDEAHSHLRSYL